ncbi:DUF488 family protein [Paracoccus limosus]|uniref:DUF488 family protein n=1 Tax=Paracoccus limosus TaxID=913252 RepID=A0A844H6K3_9RHOB|nr:DUF488 domain-containing protein [Paracoccus limosus]MTH36402.1 DUF488 family protein [Paracoccus limosus]
MTIGHSDRSIGAFIALLVENRVGHVADVRKLPGSRAQPQFDGPALAAALAGAGIGYGHLPALGGLRGRAPQVAPAVDGFWQNRSFHNYADYALSPAFRAGLQELLAEGQAQICAIMCAEAVWWRCHRRIIADYLIAGGHEVFHIMGPGRVEPARLTPGAQPQPDGRVLYPAGGAAGA